MEGEISPHWLEEHCLVSEGSPDVKSFPFNMFNFIYHGQPVTLDDLIDGNNLHLHVHT